MKKDEKILITEAEFQKMENEVWHRYLKEISQAQLYHTLICSNWDSNEYLLQWIKEDRLTDKAVILAAYWLSEPYFAKQYKDREDVLQRDPWYIDGFDFTETIEQRYLDGYYSVSEIACDPKNIEHLEPYEPLADRTLDHSDIQALRPIPAEMFEPLSGADIGPVDHYAYTEGLPNAYYEETERLFERYEISQ